jgi:hypothetical protein
MVKLPPDLQRAQDSIALPEVQEMLEKLSHYNLGVFMPHMHDDDTGEFLPLRNGVTQVEDGLKVSFQPEEACVDRPGRSYMPVGWFWQAGGAKAEAKCVANCVAMGTMHTSGHTQEDGEKKEETG